MTATTDTITVETPSTCLLYTSTETWLVQVGHTLWISLISDHSLVNHRIDSLCTVSYTHLDVYKRQGRNPELGGKS